MSRLFSRNILVATIVFIASALLNLASAQDGKGKFTTLFDGKSLDGWNKIGDANWHLVKDPGGDYVEADKGSTSFLITPKSYTNFTVRAEFWVADAATNSGVFIRSTDPKLPTADNAYEVNIFDARPDPAYRTGGIVNVASPKSKVDAADGKWHTYEITADGDHFIAKWDGVVVADGHDAKHPSGAIALQYGAGKVRFRKVEIQTR